MFWRAYAKMWAKGHREPGQRSACRASRAEANAYGKADPLAGIGSGLSTVEFGARLRYEITRQFAPYFGVEHDRAFGNTADLRRNAGHDAGDTRVVAGVRVWF